MNELTRAIAKKLGNLAQAWHRAKPSDSRKQYWKRAPK